MPRSEVLRTFSATDAAGREYAVEVVQEYDFSHDEQSGFAGWRPTLKKMRLTTGERVYGDGRGRHILVDGRGLSVELTLTKPGSATA